MGDAAESELASLSDAALDEKTGRSSKDPGAGAAYGAENRRDPDSTVRRGVSAGEVTRKFSRSWQCSGCRKLLMIAIEVAIDPECALDQKFIRCPACREGGWLGFPNGERTLSVVVTDPEQTTTV